MDNVGLESVQAVYSRPGDSQTTAVRARLCFSQQRVTKSMPDFKFCTTNPNPFNFRGVFNSKKMSENGWSYFQFSRPKLFQSIIVN